MAETLHRAIRDAIRDSPGYDAKGILPVVVLEATIPLHAEDSLLYRAVYTIFRALPERLVSGTTLNVATGDGDGGVQLMWEAKETVEATPAQAGHTLRDVFGHGRHGDLVEIAIRALEEFCNVRAGFVETFRERVSTSSSFDRPAHVIRRVEAWIPAAKDAPGARREPEAEPKAKGEPDEARA